jgi:hypothetical protein
MEILPDPGQCFSGLTYRTFSDLISWCRYFHKETDNVKVAQGVSGSIVDKGSVLRYLPYLVRYLQSVLGIRDILVRIRTAKTKYRNFETNIP